MVPDPMPAVSHLRPTADRDGQPYPMPLLSLTLPLTLIAPTSLEPSSPRALACLPLPGPQAN